jgi:hypothetical protein
VAPSLFSFHTLKLVIAQLNVMHRTHVSHGAEQTLHISLKAISGLTERQVQLCDISLPRSHYTDDRDTATSVW